MLKMGGNSFDKNRFILLLGKTKGILYVVDTSAPECIGNSTIHLVELLTQVILLQRPAPNKHSTILIN